MCTLALSLILGRRLKLIPRLSFPSSASPRSSLPPRELVRGTRLCRCKSSGMLHKSICLTGQHHFDQRGMGATGATQSEKYHEISNTPVSSSPIKSKAPVLRSSEYSEVQLGHASATVACEREGGSAEAVEQGQEAGSR